MVRLLHGLVVMVLGMTGTETTMFSELRRAKKEVVFKECQLMSDGN